MARKEINFIRPQEVYTPDTGEAKVRYRGYDGNLHDVELTENLAKDVAPMIEGKLLVATTWAELKALRDGGELVAGTFYRITDYVTTTSQENTRSAGHQFDVIVLALDGSTLSEEAWAMLHDGDEYFANSNLNGWRLFYSLDNDAERFGWAEVGAPAKIVVDANGNSVEAVRDAEEDIPARELFAWTAEGNTRYYTTTEIPQGGDKVYDSDKTPVTSTEVDSYIAPTTEGKGVIWRMVDEFNNDAPYDFKNIQFVRKMTDGELDTDSGEDTWVYTFTWIDEDGNVLDASVKAQDIQNDESTVVGVHDNYIGACDSYALGASKDTLVFWLNDIVFISSYSYEDGCFYGCYDNNFGVNCYSNTFGNGCSSNNIADGFQNNTFGNGCGGNTFGNYVSRNTFGNNCYNNTFGNYVSRNTFGNNCQNNTFGNGCGGNTFGNNAYGNTFGNNCQNNTFGNNCQNNTFGNDCYNNTFGNYCYSNTFGNDCYNNTFGNYVSRNTFGNNVTWMKFLKDYTRYVIVESGNSFITLTSNKTTSSSAYLQNIMFALGANIADQESGRETISHNSVNDMFKTTYQREDSVTVNIEDL